MENENVIQISPINIPTESPTLGELFTALCKAQSEMEIAKCDHEQLHFKSKYADLAAIVKASRGALTKHGLSVIQRVLPNGGEISYLHTRLCHASGEWIESKMPITPPRNDIQAIGSYITYLRRYTYSSIVGVIYEDEDDDGEKVMGRTPNVKEATKAPEVTKESEKISMVQLTVLAKELEDQDEMLDEILEKLNISKLADVSPQKYDSVLSHVRKIKKMKDESK